MSFILEREIDTPRVISREYKKTSIIGYQLKSAGRPSNYNDEYSYLAYQFAQAGLRQIDVAKLMGISLSTFKNWLKQHEYFAIGWKRGCVLADAEVAKAVFKLAVGFEADTCKKVLMNDGSYIFKKYRIYPPNLRACKLWLRNRQPYLWK